MSGLSHKSHGELNQITSKIMLSEAPGDGVNTGVGGAILGGVANAIKFGNTARKFAQAKGTELAKYARKELSPIIKRNLNLDPNKPLAQSLLDAGAKATTNIGSKLVRDAGKTVNTLAGTTYRQARFVGKKLAPAVPLAASLKPASPHDSCPAMSHSHQDHDAVALEDTRSNRAPIPP